MSRHAYIFVVALIICCCALRPATAQERQANQVELSAMPYEALIDSIATTMEQDRYERCILFCKEALHRHPDSPLNTDILEYLGASQYETGDYRAAIQSMDIVLVRDSTSSKAFAIKAYSHHLLEENEEAIEALNKGLKFDPQNRWMLTLRATILFDTGKYEESLPDHFAILEDSPTDHRAIWNIGEIYYILQNYEKSIEYNKLAEEKFGALSPRRCAMLIDSLLKLGQFQEALSTANYYLGLYPEEGILYLLRGIIDREYHLNTEMEKDIKLAKKYGVDAQTIENFLPDLTK